MQIPIENSDSKSFFWRWLIFSLFILFFCWVEFLHHEMWKDEWQAYLIARDFPDLKSLISFLPYEGHPPLWFLYLRFVGCLMPFEDAIKLQILHLLPFLFLIYLFFFRSGESILTLLLFSTGYFIFFEYGILNRGYILTLLLSFLIIKRDSEGRHNWITSLLLFLLCLTEIFGLFIAVSITSAFIKEKKNFLKSAVGTCLGILCFVAFIYPKSSAVAESASFHQLNNFSSINIFLSLQNHLAGTYFTGIFSNFREISIGGIFLSLITLIFLHFSLINKKKVYLIFALFFIIDVLFSAFFYMGSPRQWGIGYCLFSGLILFNIPPEERNYKTRTGISFLIILLIQSMIGIMIIRKDILMPFSNSKKAGNFIKEIPKQIPILAINKSFATPVSGYTGRAFLSLPEGNTFTYFLWKEKLYLPSEKEIDSLMMKKDFDSLYILSYKPVPYRKVIFQQAFDKKNIRQENYYLYLKIKKPL